MLSRSLILRARELRRNQTPAEVTLWQYLRDRRLAGYKFKRQFVIEGYVLDFYCPEAELSIELDGTTHLSSEQKEYDSNRTQFLAGLGIEELRFWNGDIMQNANAVLQTIYAKLVARCPYIHKKQQDFH